MPQIDEADIPELLVFLGDHGVSLSAGTIAADRLVMHQRVVDAKVTGMEPRTLKKPVLIASTELPVSGHVLDGNHRVARQRRDGILTPFICLHLYFDVALQHLFAFPKTYSYGDGQFHPITD